MNIKAIIDSDEELRFLAESKNYNVLAERVSEKLEPIHVEIPAVRAAKYFIKHGKWRTIVQAAENGNKAAQAAVDLATLPGMMVDFADKDKATQDMWKLLIHSNLCSEEDKNEIVSWCLQPVVLSHLDVAKALKED